MSEIDERRSDKRVFNTHKLREAAPISSSARTKIITPHIFDVMDQVEISCNTCLRNSLCGALNNKMDVI
jgi:hypothetical protein